MNIFRATSQGEQPDDAQIREWIAQVLAHQGVSAEVAVRIVDEAEGADFNRRYRGKPGATNVLSFPAQSDVSLPRELAAECASELGDLVICAPVVAREAAEQGKACQAHWAHMLVHGTLHLLGYDHLEPGEARAMEAIEIEILQKMGYPDPYKDY